MEKPDTHTITFLFLGDVTSSSRALRQLRALDEMGVNTTVIGFGELRRKEALPPSVRNELLPFPEGRGPRFFRKAHKQAWHAVHGVTSDLYLASDLYMLPAAAHAAKEHNAALVYDSRELYSGLSSAIGRPWVGWGWGFIERRHIRFADAVLTVSDAIADRLAARYGITHPEVLYNAPEQEYRFESGDVLRERFGLDERPIILYQGQFRNGRGLLALADAVATIPELQLVLIGEGALESKLREKLKTFDTRSRIIPFTPPDELPPLTASADLGVLLIENMAKSLRFSLPNKLFEYLAAGLPVLASPLPEISRVLKPSNVGYFADPQDPDAIAHALRTFLSTSRSRDDWRLNAKAALAPYRWKKGAKRFKSIIKNLL